MSARLRAQHIRTEAPVNRKTIVTIAVAAALGGGAAGVVLLSPALANAGNRAAQAPAAYPSGTPGGNGAPGAPGQGHGGPGGRHELVSDESVVAKAIGISESDLSAAV